LLHGSFLGRGQFCSGAGIGCDGYFLPRALGLAVPLVVAVLVSTPPIGAVLMSISTIIVAINTRLLKI